MKVKIFTILTLAVVLFLAACGKGDADLQKAATDKLAADKVSGVTASVSEGNVTLNGSVASKEELAKAMQAASSTNPKHIENKIEIKK